MAMNAMVFLVGDSVILVSALLLGDVVLYLVNDIPVQMDRSLLILPVWMVGSIFFKIVPGWGLGAVEEFRRTVILLISIFGIVAAVIFLGRIAQTTSRITYLLSFGVSITALPLMRTLYKRILINLGLWGAPTVVYGTDESVQHVIDVITNEQGLGYIAVGIFDDQTPVGNTIGGIPVLGGLHDATEAAPFAIVGTQSIERERLRELLEGPLANYRKVIIIPDLLNIPSLWVRAHDFMGVLGLELVRNLLNPSARWIKQLSELLVVLALAPFWVAVCIVLAALIWLEDRHFPFYTQQRVGRNGRPFYAWKFRSMVWNAEDVLHERLQEDSSLMEEWQENHKLRDDPRTTRIGRFLRKSSLDELPQLINVLRREMSLVGPRPLPTYHYHALPPRVQELRSQVLPGITGLWQVSGRSESGTEGMERWDTYYVRNWSVWLDIVILVRTVRAVYSGKGAY
jgi:Undecaprenyl-phosphate galactose phosphotransferase WbaP